jgi:hypothetical protein
MRDAPAELSASFSVADVVAWFHEHYPKIKNSTITAHIRGLSANDPNRHHYPWLAAKEPVFTKTGYGKLRRFDPDDIGGEGGDDGSGGIDEEEGEDQPTTEEQAEFVLESQLEEFLIGNWSVIHWGRHLQIWKSPTGVSGHQYNIPGIGRLDFLCIDTTTNALVVLELKRGRPSDKVVGQIARYMGWVRTNLADAGQTVEGLIVAHETNLALDYAVSAIPGLRLMTYEVKFELSTAGIPGQPVPPG